MNARTIRGRQERAVRESVNAAAKLTAVGMRVNVRMDDGEVEESVLQSLFWRREMLVTAYPRDLKKGEPGDSRQARGRWR